MDSRVLVLSLSLLSLLLTPSSAINPCLYNREDILPCTGCYPDNAGCVSPSENEYTVHATRLQRGSNGFFVCVRREDGEIHEDIEDLGLPDVKFLFSPGAERLPEMDYVNQTLVEYNVQCAAGRTAYLQFDKFDLEPKNCADGTVMKCRDYVQVDAGTGGVMEYCGNNPPSQPFVVGTGSFTLKLRTSFFSDFPGFRIFVTCFDSNQEINLNSCTNTGGPLLKRDVDVFQLVDLSAPLQPDRELDLAAPINTKFAPTKITLTSSDLRTLRSLSKSLFEVALSQARRKLPAWPPSSYLKNEPNDITSLSELNEPVDINPVSLTPIVISLPPPPPPSFPPDIFLPIKQPDVIGPVLQKRKRRTLISSAGSLARLDTASTLQAVRFEEACNVIVRTVSSNYLTIAQRLEPQQLSFARQEFQKELEFAAGQPPEDLVLQPNQDLNLQPQLQLQ